MFYKKLQTFTILIACLAFIPKLADAQMFIGSKVSGAYTNIEGDMPGNNYQLNGSGGLIVGYTFTEDDLFSIQSEIQYSLKGLNQKYEEVPDLSSGSDAEEVRRQYDNDLDLTYIEMPIMAKVSFSLGSSTFPYGTGSGPFNFDLYAGPYVGYLMNAEATTRLTTTRTIETITEDGQTQEQTITTESNRGRFRVENQFEDGVTMPEIIEMLQNSEEGNQLSEAFNYPDDLKSGLSTIDLGLTAGLGMSLDVGENSKITLDGRFSRGILSVDKLYFNSINVEYDDDGNLNVEQSKADLFNTAVSVNLGYIYKFGGGYTFN